MGYKGFETSFSLLVSYEVISLQYNRKCTPRADEDGVIKTLMTRPSMHFRNYGYTFALLSINAAIVEGIMRSILSEMVVKDADHQIDIRKKSCGVERTFLEKQLNKLSIEIETKGGWSELKKNYADYLNLVIDKKISSQTKEAIDTLFTLRNIFSHGTAIIHPSEQVPDDFKDGRIFKWQSRLQSTHVYLKKQFGHNDIFENLAEFKVPEHFLEKTKDFLREILPAIQHEPQRIKKTIAAIQDFSFGYVNVTM